MDAQAPSSSASSILIVDDSRTNLQVMGKRLTHMGYCVSLADNGVDALDLVQARRFDLALIDMMMPRLSGIAVLRELRANVATASLPVLMVTARSDDAAAVEALRAGADDHIVKPFAFDVLGARIERVLERGRAYEKLRRANEGLDARIVHRAIELGELRYELDGARADRHRLAANVQSLEAEVRRLSAGTSALS